MSIPRILIIAGSDSGGGAGLQADIKTVSMLGGHAMTAVTAITAQNTLGVQRVMPVPPDMVLAQIESCASDIGIDAVKIGMLGSAETARAVAEWLERVDVPVVLDPVMVATSGDILADVDTIAGFERLMRLAAVVTPNLPELAALGGEAAVLAHGCAVLVKGGHANEPEVEDRLVTAEATYRYHGPRLATRHTHGTGCTLASAIATGLGAGLALDWAVDRAVMFVRAALKHAPELGRGSGPISQALGRIPFYDHLAATDEEGWGVAALTAMWN